jgi:Lar family restriction alleviation protein
MSELKPCPFCGGDAGIEMAANDISYYVFCSKCSSCTDYFDAQADAIAVWNTRHPDPIIVELLNKLDSEHFKASLGHGKGMYYKTCPTCALIRRAKGE